MIVGALIVLLAIGAVGAYQWREARQADAALQRAGTSIKTQVQRFHREHAELPSGLRLRPDAVELVGTSAKETNTIDLDEGIRLAWYRDEPDRRLSTSAQSRTSGYTYCLAFHGRHWRLNATEEAVATGGRADGSCPAAPAP
jgi:hypothetical protein